MYKIIPVVIRRPFRRTKWNDWVNVVPLTLLDGGYRRISLGRGERH